MNTGAQQSAPQGQLRIKVPGGRESKMLNEVRVRWHLEFIGTSLHVPSENQDPAPRK
jgi:hypothetical protein